MSDPGEAFPTVHAWGGMAEVAMSPTVARKTVTGERMTLARIRIAAGGEVPVHAHENEQMSCVLEGALRFVLGEEDREEVVVVRAGEVLHIPADVPHGAEALEDTLVLDLFSPRREDWLEGDG